jgi:C-terminal processing protease CtpA/Prc
VITKVNGETTESLIKKYVPITPGSNYQAQLRDIPKSMGFLFAGGGSSINLTIKRSGKTHNLSVRRIAIDSTVINIDYMPKRQKGYTIKNNIGYLYPATMQDSDSETIKNALMHTRGIIVDMRGYPTIQMPFTYGKWLKKEETPFAVFSRPSTNMPGQFYLEDPVMNGGGDTIYKGKIVIIVNSETQSSGEYQTMALASTPGAITIGSTSAGADGNVCMITLPGGIHTAFSGLGVLYPDGTETQRKGIKIDRVVTPTVNGIKEGRDELMEAAIAIIGKE